MSQTAFVATEGGGVPPDTYSGKITGFEDYEENVESYGPALLVAYMILSGKHKGESTSRIFSKKFSKKANLRKFAEVLNCGPLKNGESFDFQRFIGMRGTIVVAETDSGATRVETFLPDFAAWEKSKKVEHDDVDSLDEELEDEELDEDDLEDAELEEGDLDEEEPSVRSRPKKKKAARRKRR